ncbi:MAG: RagB/SusD family nutrient uptake outer membrane protein [candidate division KSB1 bacterium]|nr:RagB/SusD family nutrient uptake outer membrane protein [candidate division KSB1 bacterium]MDZ7334792.1 RagB/SusD family nutrient uptake outer membrane protein [candidate division KSB1 bacterium]MDZ7358125.1 RagB/SusD family nutrient uptake outer membrane protein [candidate division KSB1 bacterium]MDZ7400789.1 RagB/SusD family nutrient uptake outer membrane protein [candidate division KSB1 bacterium]
MKRLTALLILLLSSLLIWSSCEDYATSVDPLIDQVEDARLTSESQTPFVINGLKTRFATTHDQLGVLAGLLSDELFFDSNVPNATFPTFRDIDEGQITLDNNSVDGVFNALGELRFFSDDIIRRVGEITFTNEALKNEALFNGNLYGGIARYIYGAYFGLSQEQGGGVIDNGPFIPSNEMFGLAIEKFQQALTLANDAQKRLINSLIARIYLLKGDFANVRNFAQNGMIEGDEPFQSKHSIQSDNYFWQQAGKGRTQAVLAPRFRQYVIDDPAELARVPIDSILGNNKVMYYRQGKYPNESSPITFMNWQENELMLAECDLRAGNSAGALDRINKVRASHGLSPLASADMNVLITERDKELFVTGARLLDQRRLDSEFKTWHLPAGSWRYFPITERERNINPNLGHP